MTLLENLVYRDQSLECLDLVGENGLPVIGDSWLVTAIPDLIITPLSHVHFHASPESRGRLVVPRVDNAASHMFPCNKYELLDEIRYGGRIVIVRWGQCARNRGGTYVWERFPLLCGLNR